MESDASHLRMLIEKVRVYDVETRSLGIHSKSRYEMLRAVNDAEIFLNRPPEEEEED